MSEVPSEIQGISSTGALSSTEPTVRCPLSGNICSTDSELRALIEEYAFQVLSQRSFVKRPHHTLCVSGTDADNNFCSLTFPRKLWELVESDKFKSIWWDEDGTSIVINEELFKKEVLERKPPFRIFETDSMKSLVRQLNLYGFSKIRQNFQGSASLPDFLEEEKQVLTLNKLQFYHNKNFIQGCPHLLEKMKRRVRTKNPPPVITSLVSDVKKRKVTAKDNMDKYNAEWATENNTKSFFATPTCFEVPLLKPSSSQATANTIDQMRSKISPPSSSSFRPPEHVFSSHHTVLHRVTTCHLHSHKVCAEDKDNTMGFITNSISQEHMVSPLENNYFGLAVGHPILSPYESPPNLVPTGNQWSLIPRVTVTSSSSSMSTHQLYPIYQYYPFSNDS